MSSSTYELTNRYYGKTSPLAVDTSSSDLELLVSTSSSALNWTSTPTAANRYNICTSYNGKAYCLDIVNTSGSCPDDCTVVHLAAPGPYSGQQWTLLEEDGGTQKLSNDFTGSGWYLNTYSDTKGAFMSDGNYLGQYWSFNEVGQGSSASSTALSSSSQSASSVTKSTSDPTTTSHTQSSISRPSDSAAGHSSASKADSSSGLSTGASIGIGVGVGIAALAAIILIVVVCLSRRKRKRRQATQGPSARLATDMIWHNTSSQGWQDKPPGYTSPRSNRRSPEQLQELEGAGPGELEGNEPGRSPSELPSSK